ncbi:uncharacterized protein HHUB_3231 [Halobacterium hubeiense]|uniref:Uncharacterized protein n=1 Tax=Halobacterium hubeiense TaxID=1407499 RepID=A0A0U5AHM1_9EURY|nr:hypothetical protein [Halobacterium hubeiense]CQH60516.1 uncharacterized protein HHUB_3231 [Halobacterium hubeiense]
MPAFPDPDHAVRIAANELRIAWRKLRGKSTAQLASVGIVVLFGVAFTAAAAYGAYLGGRGVATDPGDVSSLLGLVPAALATLTLFMAAYMTVIQLGDVDARDGYLTTVPARDVVGGLLLAGYVRASGLFVAPLLVASVAFAVGAGSPLSLPLAALAVLALTATAFLVGFPVGAAIAYLGSRSALVARFKTVIGAVVFLAYFWLIVSGTFDEVVDPILDVAEASPVSWYADLATLAVVPGASAAKAGAVVVGSVVLGAGGVLASVRLSERRWYTESVEAGERETDSVAGGRLDRLVGRRPAWVARKSWLRARRAPIRLVFVAYPAFLLVTPVQASVEAGRVTASLPPSVALYGAWMTGAAFTLNPLGDEGAVLPVTAISGVSGREFVGGLVVASAVFGAPLTLAVAGGLALASPLPPVALACTVVAAVVLPVLAAALAAGVGTTYPKYDATNVSRSREVVVPSMWAFGVYTLAFLLTAGIATAVQVPAAAGALANAVGVTDAAAHVGALAVGVLLTGVLATVSVRIAVRAFDDYTA